MSSSAISTSSRRQGSSQPYYMLKEKGKKSSYNDLSKRPLSASSRRQTSSQYYRQNTADMLTKQNCSISRAYSSEKGQSGSTTCVTRKLDKEIFESSNEFDNSENNMKMTKKANLKADLLKQISRNTSIMSMGSKKTASTNAGTTTVIKEDQTSQESIDFKDIIASPKGVSRNFNNTKSFDLNEDNSIKCLSPKYKINSIFNFEYYSQNAISHRVCVKKDRPEVNIASSRRTLTNDENVNTINNQRSPQKNCNSYSTLKSPSNAQISVQARGVFDRLYEPKSLRLLFHKSPDRLKNHDDVSIKDIQFTGNYSNTKSTANITTHQISKSANQSIEKTHSRSNKSFSVSNGGTTKKRLFQSPSNQQSKSALSSPSHKALLNKNNNLNQRFQSCSNLNSPTSQLYKQQQPEKYVAVAPIKIPYSFSQASSPSHKFETQNILNNNNSNSQILRQNDIYSQNQSYETPQPQQQLSTSEVLQQYQANKNTSSDYFNSNENPFKNNYQNTQNHHDQLSNSNYNEYYSQQNSRANASGIYQGEQNNQLAHSQIQQIYYHHDSTQNSSKLYQDIQQEQTQQEIRSPVQQRLFGSETSNANPLNFISEGDVHDRLPAKISQSIQESLRELSKHESSQHSHTLAKSGEFIEPEDDEQREQQQHHQLSYQFAESGSLNKDLSSNHETSQSINQGIYHQDSEDYYYNEVDDNENNQQNPVEADKVVEVRTVEEKSKAYQCNPSVPQIEEEDEEYDETEPALSQRNDTERQNPIEDDHVSSCQRKISISQGAKTERGVDELVSASSNRNQSRKGSSNDIVHYIIRSETYNSFPRSQYQSNSNLANNDDVQANSDLPKQIPTEEGLHSQQSEQSGRFHTFGTPEQQQKINPSNQNSSSKKGQGRKILSQIFPSNATNLDSQFNGNSNSPYQICQDNENIIRKGNFGESVDTDSVSSLTYMCNTYNSVDTTQSESELPSDSILKKRDINRLAVSNIHQGYNKNHLQQKQQPTSTPQYKKQGLQQLKELQTQAQELHIRNGLAGINTLRTRTPRSNRESQNEVDLKEAMNQAKAIYQNLKQISEHNSNSQKENQDSEVPQKNNGVNHDKPVENGVNSALLAKYSHFTQASSSYELADDPTSGSNQYINHIYIQENQ